MSIHFRPSENFSRIVELTPQLRREIEATVERLIAILDVFDGDENCEDDAYDDREDEDEHGGDILDEPHDDQDEGEPWLGWTEVVNQTDMWRLAGGILLDGEMDAYGEPDNSKSDNIF
ncbi:MAG: hypothetical protein LCH47_11195 [Proteobacteria bacterium]|nr:hypothetical protein [Pseudomonadota bacterium]